MRATIRAHYENAQLRFDQFKNMMPADGMVAAY
jgi:hypothetical protein